MSYFPWFVVQFILPSKLTRDVQRVTIRSPYAINEPMKFGLNLVLLGLIAGLLTACGQRPQSSTSTSMETNTVSTPNTNEVAILKTAQGEMVIEFWSDVAPNTVENFKKLAKQGFYDGTAFHRIIKGFMIQGGDPLSKSNSPAVGTGGPGYKIKAEFNNRKHERGVLSMARSQNPDSAGSQFFICLGDAAFLNGQYTAFGHVIKGDDVLGKLGDSPVVLGNGGEKSVPVDRVGLESVKIVPADSVK